MAKQATEDKHSDKVVDCGFCPNKEAYLYTIDSQDAWWIIACCAACKRNRVPESRIYGFIRWLWPKDAATMKAEMKK